MKKFTREYRDIPENAIFGNRYWTATIENEKKKKQQQENNEKYNTTQTGPTGENTPLSQVLHRYYRGAKQRWIRQWEGVVCGWEVV